MHVLSLRQSILTVIIPNRRIQGTVETSLKEEYGEKNVIIEKVDISEDPIVMITTIKGHDPKVLQDLCNIYSTCRFSITDPKTLFSNIVGIILTIYGTLGVTIGLIKAFF